MIDPVANHYEGEKSGDKQRGRCPTSRPDVIIFKHDHARKIESMRVYPTDKHTVLLNESETYIQILSMLGATPNRRTILPGVVLRVPAMMPRKP